MQGGLFLVLEPICQIYVLLDERLDMGVEVLDFELMLLRLIGLSQEAPSVLDFDARGLDLCLFLS